MISLFPSPSRADLDAARGTLHITAGEDLVPLLGRRLYDRLVAVKESL